MTDNTFSYIFLGIALLGIVLWVVTSVILIRRKR